jgi:hypothetical protein
VEGPEKYQLMADAHAVMMPSRHETFGMVAVESLAAGGPPVAFDVGPLREVAGGGAGEETGARLVRAVGGLPNSGVPNTSNPRSGRGRVYVAPGPSDAEQSRLPRRGEAGDEEGSTR